VDVARIRPLLAGFELRVFLDQSLLSLLEDEARWVLNSGFVEPAPMPGYLDMVDVRPLSQLKPDVVTVIR
jgi:NitT/TauT family transport system substrate-binding protein